MLLDNYKKESPIIGVAGMGGGINSYIFLSAGGGGDVISKSLRFNSSNSSYLSTTTPNITTFTYSAWIKRCGESRDDILVSGSSTGFYLYFHTDGTIKINTNSGNVFTSNGQYRDPSAWYNISFSNNGSTFNLYVNGVLDKSVSLATQFYSGVLTIAKGSTNYADYYLADVHLVDGQALTPTNFGETDSDGVWQPKKYSGTYGTNGSHLDFKDTDAIGNDAAGSNNWTANNITTAVYGLATANQGMDVVTYTGDGNTRSISSLNFSPDLVWFKNRGTSNYHQLHDRVRGPLKRIYSNSSDAENDYTTALTSFDSNGWTMGNGTPCNASGNNYVAWCWKAGGAASSNSNGTITSSVSANASYGFSIVSYNSGSSTGNYTLGHGLSSAPKFIIHKSRSTGNWWAYHASVIDNTSKYLQLNSTAAVATNSAPMWGASLPTSSVFGIRVGDLIGTSTDTIAYVWSEVTGFSKFGSYTGNGSNTGPVIACGFSPRYVLIKRTDSGGNWGIYDTARHEGTDNNLTLAADTNSAESTDNNKINITDTGFSPASGYANVNASGGTYIYAAFASKPDPSSIDSLSDSPAQVANQTDSGVGNEVVGNYCTLNALENNGITLSNGNLDVARSTNSWASSKGTIGVPSGKYYFEYTVNSGSSYQAIGIHKTDVQMPGVSGTGYIHVTSAAWVYQTDGNLGHANSFTNTGVTSSSGDVVMIALDVDAGKVWFGKNGTWFSSGNPATGANPSYSNITGTISPATSIYGTQTGSFNFGQRAFAHAAPSGYKSLNTANLPTPTIADGSQYFDTSLWTGNGATGSRALTGLSFSPDFTWLKGRSYSISHLLYDSVRGAGSTKSLVSNGTNTEGSAGDNATFGYVSSFDTNGFSIYGGSDVNNGYINKNGATYVSWNWDAGTSTVTNNDGSVASQVRANQTAGFSIVTYTGGGANGSTIGHGLNKKPELIILKSRTAAENWFVNYPVGTGDGYLMLNQTNAGDGSNATVWNSTAPTSSVFTIGSSSGVNGSQSYVAYCFAPISGYSAMGTATGNGSADGPYIHTGFKVKFLIYKRSDNTSNWLVYDTARNPTNVGLYVLSADNTGGGNTYDAHNNQLGIDFLSNGFKIRSSNGDVNTSGASYIYYAVAEHPFKTARAR